ncbi:MAG: DUF3592 domain-containing protein [Acidobacteriota bacterium]|jgi:hypothetical protein
MKSSILLQQPRIGWIPPDGLDHSRPRAVRLTVRGKALVALALALLSAGIVAGVLLETVAVREARESRLLLRETVPTSGVVTRLWRGKGENRQPWITYRFQIWRQTYDNDAKIPLGIWQNLRIGSTVPVHFVPSHPDLSYAYDYVKMPLPSWVPLVVGFSLAFCGSFAFLPLLRQRHLLSEGRPTPGTVTKHGRLQRGSHGEKLGVKLYYDFYLLSGALAHGKIGPIKNPPPIGSAVSVLYDAENPQISAPYPFPSPLVRLVVQRSFSRPA